MRHDFYNHHGHHHGRHHGHHHDFSRRGFGPVGSVMGRFMNKKCSSNYEVGGLMGILKGRIMGKNMKFLTGSAPLNERAQKSKGHRGGHRFGPEASRHGDRRHHPKHVGGKGGRIHPRDFDMSDGEFNPKDFKMMGGGMHRGHFGDRGGMMHPKDFHAMGGRVHHGHHGKPGKMHFHHLDIMDGRMHHGHRGHHGGKGGKMHAKHFGVRGAKVRHGHDVREARNTYRDDFNDWEKKMRYGNLYGHEMSDNKVQYSDEPPSYISREKDTLIYKKKPHGLVKSMIGAGKLWIGKRSLRTENATPINTDKSGQDLERSKEDAIVAKASCDDEAQHAPSLNDLQIEGSYVWVDNAVDEKEDLLSDYSEISYNEKDDMEK